MIPKYDASVYNASEGLENACTWLFREGLNPTHAFLDPRSWLYLFDQKRLPFDGSMKIYIPMLVNNTVKMVTVTFDESLPPRTAKIFHKFGNGYDMELLMAEVILSG